MNENRKVLHKRRVWLSPDTTAFVYATLENDDGYRYGELKISDCNKAVRLDINVSNKKERKATVKKLDMLSQEIEALANAVVDMNE